MPEMVHQFRHGAMATVYEIYIANEERPYAEQAAMAAFAEVDRIEQALNRFLLSSDVGRFNHAPPNEWMHVSIYTMECLQVAARSVSVACDGVQPASQLPGSCSSQLRIERASWMRVWLPAPSSSTITRGRLFTVACITRQRPASEM